MWALGIEVGNLSVEVITVCRREEDSSLVEMAVGGTNFKNFKTHRQGQREA